MGVSAGHCQPPVIASPIRLSKSCSSFVFRVWLGCDGMKISSYSLSPYRLTSHVRHTLQGRAANARTAFCKAASTFCRADWTRATRSLSTLTQPVPSFRAASSFSVASCRHRSVSVGVQAPSTKTCASSILVYIAKRQVACFAVTAASQLSASSGAAHGEQTLPTGGRAAASCSRRGLAMRQPARTAKA